MPENRSLLKLFSDEKKNKRQKNTRRMHSMPLTFHGIETTQQQRALSVFGVERPLLADFPSKVENFF